jgi:hypothetical protein
MLSDHLDDVDLLFFALLMERKTSRAFQECS